MAEGSTPSPDVTAAPPPAETKASSFGPDNAMGAMPKLDAALGITTKPYSLDAAATGPQLETKIAMPSGDSAKQEGQSVLAAPLEAQQAQGTNPEQMLRNLDAGDTANPGPDRGNDLTPDSLEAELNNLPEAKQVNAESGSTEPKQEQPASQDTASSQTQEAGSLTTSEIRQKQDAILDDTSLTPEQRDEALLALQQKDQTTSPTTENAQGEPTADRNTNAEEDRTPEETRVEQRIRRDEAAAELKNMGADLRDPKVQELLNEAEADPDKMATLEETYKAISPSEEDVEAKAEKTGLSEAQVKKLLESGEIQKLLALVDEGLKQQNNKASETEKKWLDKLKWWQKLLLVLTAAAVAIPATVAAGGTALAMNAGGKTMQNN